MKFTDFKGNKMVIRNMSVKYSVFDTIPRVIPIYIKNK